MVGKQKKDTVHRTRKEVEHFLQEAHKNLSPTERLRLVRNLRIMMEDATAAHEVFLRAHEKNSQPENNE